MNDSRIRRRAMNRRVTRATNSHTTRISNISKVDSRKSEMYGLCPKINRCKSRHSSIQERAIIIRNPTLWYSKILSGGEFFIGEIQFIKLIRKSPHESCRRDANFRVLLPFPAHEGERYAAHHHAAARSSGKS